MKEEIGWTKHGKERFVERVFNDIAFTHLHKAFNQRARLSEKEVMKEFIKDIPYNRGYFTKEYRKYKGRLYIFGAKSETKDTIFYRLITVI